MFHRLPLLVAGLMVAAIAGIGCTNDPVQSNCAIEPHVIDPTVLTLLPDARLDRVGDGFVLFGTDGNKVYWASLDTNGAIGDQREYMVPSHAGQIWFAAAGTTAPMDHVLVAYVSPSPAVMGMVDLMAVSVGFDGTMPTLPIVTGQIPATANVAMSSGRGGMHAGVTWGVQGTSKIAARILGGDGQVIGSDLALGTVGDFDCLRFSPGKGDLTVGYVDLSGTPPVPRFVGTEISPAGSVQPAFTLSIGKELPGCVELVPADTGYGVAWHAAKIGTSFAVYDPASPQFPNHLVLADVRVPVPPGLGGLGWMGKSFALVFAHETGAEVWPIDAMGLRQGTLPVFPSSVGHTGTLSTQPVGNALYATYADYTYADPANRSAGQRLLVKVTCP
jgi:hypothetical protein